MNNMTDQSEIWKDVPGYEGFQVSNTGRVRRLPYTYTNAKGHLVYMKGREITTFTNPKGYQRCDLCVHGTKKKPFTVHRLVMYAFKGMPPAGMDQINHKDGNKQNNHPDNLEYSNNSHNITHAWRTGLFKPNLPSSVNYHKARIVVHNQIGTFYTVKEAAEMEGIDRSKLTKMLQGKRPNKTNYSYA